MKQMDDRLGVARPLTYHPFVYEHPSPNRSWGRCCAPSLLENAWKAPYQIDARAVRLHQQPNTLYIAFEDSGGVALDQLLPQANWSLSDRLRLALRLT
jgi:hypothetical protein